MNRLALTLAVLLLLPAPSFSQYPGGVCPPLPAPGTVFATRNGDESLNTTHGSYWNHLAIMGPNGWVIEAQRDHGVIAVPWSCFWRRYPEILALKVTDDGAKAASAAVTHLGEPYHLIGGSCVVLVRRSIRASDEQPHGWVRPDHVVRDAKCRFWCKDDPLWTPPADWFAGRTASAARVLGEQAR